ncbi:RNA-directed DNA polymerase, eukaryota [Tanacetum coccineum]
MYYSDQIILRRDGNVCTAIVNFVLPEEVNTTKDVEDKDVIQLVLWIVNSGCSKHMTNNLQLLRNFIEKFIRTVCFGNDHFAAITRYVDYVQGNLTICLVYYVEGLGHNLVRQFCDGDLEVSERTKKNIPSSNNVLPRKNASPGTVSNSFAAVLKSGSVNHNTVTESSPAIVLDDACIMERDFSCSLMGKMKDINALSNLFIILANEGFENVKLFYLGGQWVLLELDSVTSKEKITNHVGVGSWFEVLKPACNSFVCEERLVWVAIEGLPVKALTRNTVCVRTKPHVLINDRVKIIIKGQLHWICVKEQEAWMPEFKTVMEDDTSSDEESEGNNENDRGSDNEHVSEMSFAHENVDEFQVNPKPNYNTVISKDPFGIYKILKRNKDANVTEGDTHTPQYPPGFTPNVEENVVDNIPGNASQPKPNPTTSGNKEKASSVNDKFQASGSILEVMDELIKVGQTMGYNMDGCMKNIEAIIGSQGDSEALWGNLSFDYAFSPSIGYSGGILCVWDPRLFVKDNSTVSDSFLAISGTWIPSSTKLLVISVYAPQDLTERRMLWDFIHHLIDSWDGECVLLGDFNEVRFEHERRGSLFNSHGANSFNNFITRTGLIDLPLEGYSFTWAHKSASKMSKLDRFLISEGLLALFPSISALCLDKHLSDHRPILLRELNVDYGPTPFRFFHSWSSRKGFDKMVEDSWKNSVCMESNSIIKLKKKLQSLKSSIKHWLAEDNQKSNEHKRNIQNRLIILDKIFDQGSCNDDLIHERSNLLKELQDFNKSSSLDMAQKAKIRWAIEGDENSKFFHRIINKKRSQLAIHGVLADGDWIIESSLVKNEFFKHFATRFAAPSSSSITFDY